MRRSLCAPYLLCARANENYACGVMRIAGTGVPEIATTFGEVPLAARQCILFTDNVILYCILSYIFENR